MTRQNARPASKLGHRLRSAQKKVVRLRAKPARITERQKEQSAGAEKPTREGGQYWGPGRPVKINLRISPQSQKALKAELNKLPGDVRAILTAAVRESDGERDEAEILTRVQPWAGSRKAARHWYEHEKLAPLGNVTASELVRRGDARLVRSYLDAIAVGGYA